MTGTPRTPGWVGALASTGLDALSPPEAASSIHELTHSRRVFLGLLERAAGWPDESVVGWRVPDPADVDGLDVRVPRSRAIVSAHDERAVLAAAVLFRVVLVLDPFWMARGALYAAWHDPSGLTEEHSAAFERMARLGLRLSALHASGAVQYVPDHLPGSWEPWPMRSEGLANPPPFDEPLATHTAARLVYWADRLRAVALAAHPKFSGPLGALAGCGADLLHTGREATLRVPSMQDEAHVTVWRGTTHRPGGSGWGRVFDRQCGSAHPHPERLVEFLERQVGGADPVGTWRLGIGARELPDVSLILRRASAGRPLLRGVAGKPFQLRRRVVYVVPSAR